MIRYALVMLASLLGLVAAPALAKNVALVVGNGSYANTSALTNPPRDAEAFAQFLREAGYDVTLAVDATRAQMSEALSAFARKLETGDTAVFFFAGHGLQMDGENYLVGTEAKLLSEFDVPAETVQLASIVQTMESKAHVSMIFIDACRNNPMAQSLARETTRSIANGMAPVQTKGDGTMIAFAAQPGALAFDGTGSNSPFTAALVKHLATPGVEIGTAFKRVIAEVRLATENRQSPQLVSSLATEIYMGGQAGSGSTVVDAVPQIDLAELDYAKAERLNTTRGWQLFLTKHPTGFFADLAQQALNALLGGAPSESLTPQQAEERLELSRQLRSEVQVALNGLGYQVGSPDGVFGPNTRRQIARYQAAAGLQETGFVSAPMLTKLGIALVTSEAAVVSADEARRFNTADLEGLETDERLLSAISCLRHRELKYGFYQGRIYIAVLTYGMSYEDSRAEARRCGGDLVSIADTAENNFAFDLFRHDDRFIERNNDGSALVGPIIGFEQAPEGREPRGGWRWADGSPVAFTNWEQNEPSNNTPDEEFAVFWAHNQPKPGPDQPEQMTRPGWNDVWGGARGYIMEIS